MRVIFECEFVGCYTSARNLERKERVRREVKMDKCPTVELGVQDTHLREKKKKI